MIAYYKKFKADGQVSKAYSILKKPMKSDITAA
jgi:hypothetical protein